MLYSDGSRYEGNWINDQQNDLGTYYFAKGDKFTGNWQNGVRDGKGVYIYKDGERKEGVWKNDEFVSELKKEDSENKITPNEGVLKQTEKRILQLNVNNAPAYLVFTSDKSLQLFAEIASPKGESPYTVDLSAGNTIKITSIGIYQLNLIAKLGAGKWQVLLLNESEFKK
jgi:hypothetical protein